MDSSLVFVHVIVVSEDGKFVYKSFAKILRVEGVTHSQVFRLFDRVKQTFDFKFFNVWPLLKFAEELPVFPALNLVLRTSFHLLLFILAYNLIFFR